MKYDNSVANGGSSGYAFATDSGQTKAIFTSINQMLEDYLIPYYNEISAILANEAHTDEIEFIQSEMQAIYSLIQEIKENMSEIDAQIFKKYNF